MQNNDERLWVQTLWNPLEDKRKSPLESTEEGIRVAAYCRISSNVNPNNRSLQNQVSYYTEYIKSKPNWKFVGVYLDDNVSGRTVKARRSFMRMLRHAEEGKLDLIITKNVQRFSRNTKDLLETIAYLKELGVAVFFEKENLDTSTDYNAFLLSIYGSLAQAEVENMSEQERWSNEKKLLSGKPIFKRIFGYEVVKGTGGSVLKIKEEEANVIRWIFKQFLEGMSKSEISRELTRRGIKSPRGKAIWESMTISAMLKQPIYTGNTVNRRTTRDLLTNKITNNEVTSGVILIENSNPPIIDMDAYLRVQKMHESIEPRAAQKPREADHPLKGRIFCGYDNSVHHRVYNYQGKKYWTCYVREKHMERCPTNYIKEERVEVMLLHAFKHRFDFNDESTLKKLEAMIRWINENDHFEFHRLKYLTEIEIAEHLIGDRFTFEDVDELKNRYTAFEANINQIEDDRKYRDQVLEWLDTIKTFEEFLSGLDFKMMRAWIQKVTIYSEEDYIIHWIDGIDTEIGDIRSCRERAEKLQRKHLMNTGVLIPDTSIPAQDPLQVDTETVGRLIPTKDTVTEIIQIKEDIILNYRKEEDIIAKPEVMRIDNIQHMKMLHRIRKDIKESKVPTLHSKHKEKLKVAAYVRVSTDHEEQETSLKTQTAFYTYTILSNPEYALAGIYVDEGISATSTKNRDGFNQMIRDCKAGKIDLILTKSISRFARNTVDAIHYSRMLKNLDKPVNIFFEKENVSTKDDNAELMVTLLGALAQQESRNIGSSISWGKRAKASRGIVNVRRLNYGYEFDENKEWVIKEEEAAIIRRIYRAYLAGAKAVDIARDLNKDKVIPASGSGLWGNSGINKILFSHIYNGDYVHNNMYRDPELKQSLVRNRGEVPMILIENHHPAIIDRDVWESVQELRTHKQRTRKKIKQEFNNEDKRNELFDDKFICGECGSSFGFARYLNVKKDRFRDKVTGIRKHTRTADATSTSLIWRCHRAKDVLVKICDSKQFPQEYIELNFQHLIIDMITNNGFVEEYKRVYSELELTEEELEIEANLRREMDEHYQMLYEAVDEELNARGRDSKRIDSLTERLVDYQVKLKHYEEKRDRQSTLKNEVEWFMKCYCANDFLISSPPDLQGLENTRLGKKFLTPEISETGLLIEEASFDKELFERLIESARVHSDGRIVFRLKAGMEWSAPITYENYTRLLVKRIKIKSLKKYLDYINGPEVTEILRYCKTPRTSREIHSLLDTKCLDEIVRVVINPLVEMGRLKYTIPEFIQSHNQKYYSE